MSTLLPLASSLVYVAGILFLKEASARGASVWHATLVTNLFAGVVFSALWFLGGRVPEAPVAWLQPALVALLFLAGQLLGFLAIHRGDVSVATPVMGIKVILVALFVTLLIGERVTALLWAAAGLSSAGILFLSRGGGAKAEGRIGPAIGFGLLASAAFALFDVLVQKWSPAWGVGRFLPIMMGFAALYSLAMAAILRLDRDKLPAGAGLPLLIGGLLVSLQALGVIGTLAVFGRATTTNVIYSARGLWSVLAVWTVGHWFGNRERELGGAALRDRLLGAALLTAAIALAVLA